MAEKNITEVAKEEFNKMSKEEKKELIYNSERTILAKLIELNAKVNCMVDFINIIGELGIDAFSVKYNHETKEAGYNPAFFLNDYIILEISNFYTLVHQEKGIDFPKAPEYWEKIKDFRNAIPGHADKEKKFRTNKDMLSVLNPLDEIGMGNILRDFNEYFTNCMKLLQKKRK